MMDRVKIWGAWGLALLICVMFLLPITTVVTDIFAKRESLSDAAFRFEKIAASKSAGEQWHVQLQDRLELRLLSVFK